MLLKEIERLITIESYEDLEVLAANDAFIKECDNTTIEIEDVGYGFKLRKECSKGVYDSDIVELNMTYYSNFKKLDMGANYLVSSTKRAVEIIQGQMLIHGTTLDEFSEMLPDGTVSLRVLVDTFRRNNEDKS